VVAGGSTPEGQLGARVLAAVLFFLAAVVVTAAFVSTGHANAGSIAFVDANHGWRLTLVGFVDYGHPGKAVVWRTVDGGDTWKKQASRTPGMAGDGGIYPGLLAFRSATNGLWARSIWDGAHLPWQRTSTGGAAWRAARDPLDGILADVAYGSASVVWACDYIGSAPDGGSVYRSSDGGATWRRVLHKVSKPPAQPIGGFFRVSSPDARTCFVSASGEKLGGVWCTTDGGAHWARRTTPGGGAHAISFPSASTGWLVGPNGSVFKTTNAGRSWIRQLAATGERMNSICFVDLLHGWVSGDGGTMLRTADGGATWQRLDAGTDQWLYDLVFVDARHGWVTYTPGYSTGTREVILRTTDGGDTWERL